MPAGSDATHYKDVLDHIDPYQNQGGGETYNNQNYPPLSPTFDESRRVGNGYSVYRFSTQSPIKTASTERTTTKVTLDPYDLKFNMVSICYYTEKN